MIAFDYPPPDRPTLEQQQDALRKGLGRCHPWAVSGVLDHEALLHACLHDLRYDRQIDECRGDWLWSLMQGAGTVESFRETILAAWMSELDEANATQLCSLACRFARAGDNRFRVRLREVVRQNILGDTGTFGEEEMMRLDGREGVLFVAEQRGLRLSERAWDFEDRWTTGDAAKLFGADMVAQWLNESSDAAVVRFREAWAGDDHDAPAIADHGAAWDEELKRLNAEDILAEAGKRGLSDRPLPPVGRAGGRTSLGGGRSSARLHRASRDTAQTAASVRRAPLRRSRPPRHYPVRTRKSAGPPTRVPSPRAERVSGGRAIALRELHPQGAWQDAVGLLVRNYREGDESRIAELLEVPADSDDRHWLFTDVLRLLQNNANADARRLALAAYFHTPCAFCRGDAAELMKERGLAPEWLASECRNDCDNSCRAAFAPNPAPRL